MLCYIRPMALSISEAPRGERGARPQEKETSLLLMRSLFLRDVNKAFASLFSMLHQNIYLSSDSMVIAHTRIANFDTHEVFQRDGKPFVPQILLCYPKGFELSDQPRVSLLAEPDEDPEYQHQHMIKISIERQFDVDRLDLNVDTAAIGTGNEVYREQGTNSQIYGAVWGPMPDGSESALVLLMGSDGLASYNFVNFNKDWLKLFNKEGYMRDSEELVKMDEESKRGNRGRRRETREERKARAERSLAGIAAETGQGQAQQRVCLFCNKLLLILMVLPQTNEEEQKE